MGTPGHTPERSVGSKEVCSSLPYLFASQLIKEVCSSLPYLLASQLIKEAWCDALGSRTAKLRHPMQDLIRISLGSHWDLIGISSGSLRDCFPVSMGSLWHRFEIVFRFPWALFGVALG